jgi:hypothetical protein
MRTHIVQSEVRVIGLDAVVQDGHHDALARVPLLPSRRHVHVEAIFGATVL